jgi:TraY domain
MSAKKPGRPGRPPEAGERLQIGVQVSPRVKHLLETAAEQNHRSLSREAEYRLEQSFDRDVYKERLEGLKATIRESGEMTEKVLREMGLYAFRDMRRQFDTYKRTHGRDEGRRAKVKRMK